MGKLKLTEEKIVTAAEHIKAGTPQKVVAQLLGIGERTWYRWLQEGEQGKRKIARQFWQEIKKAEAEAISRNVMLINQAAQNGTWQAAAWWLERRYPEEFGRKDDFTLRHEGDLQIDLVLPKKDEDEDQSQSE